MIYRHIQSCLIWYLGLPYRPKETDFFDKSSINIDILPFFFGPLGSLINSPSAYEVLVRRVYQDFFELKKSLVAIRALIRREKS